jgi:hypothetical protein
MKKITILMCIFMMLACLAGITMFSGCKKDKPEEEDPIDGSFKYHDNTIKVFTCFDDEDGNLKSYEPKCYGWIILGGSFKMKYAQVTQGQDPDDHLWCDCVTHTEPYYCEYPMSDNKEFCFKAGRNGTKEVAESFNYACPPANNTFNEAAGKLYFWVEGTLELKFQNKKTYTFPGTFFAMGPGGLFGLLHKWWFGNQSMKNYKETILAWDPYSKTWYIPIPIYMGEKCFGYISPVEDPNLVFKFVRGDPFNGDNHVSLIGVYTKTKPTEPW